jgi:hypothetical protein
VWRERRNDFLTAKEPEGLLFCFSAAREEAVGKSMLLNRAPLKNKSVTWGSSCYKQATPLGLFDSPEIAQGIWKN